MKDLIKKYRSVVKFIVVFLTVYGVLTVAYKLYLDQSTGKKSYPDYFTHLVAVQSQALLNAVGYETQIQPHQEEPSVKIIVRDKYVARVVEGCNSISVVILFIAFLIAFSGRPKVTFFYALAGSVLIYTANLVRIVILSIGLLHYPWRRNILHTVIFPLIIYGLVFMLWMIWVKRFSHISKRNVKKA